MSEIYKYFAWKERGYWRANELLSVPQIRSILNSLEWRKEVFASIQNHDEHGNILSGPLWFDLDGHPDVVLKEARHFVAACEFVVNVTPRIYFSGGKGFHLIIERVIEHPRVHELVQDFAREMAPSLTTLDPKVYRTRSMFRIPGSPASKLGYYKIELTRAELFTLSYDAIRQLAQRQRFIDTDHDPSTLDEETFDAWLAIATTKLPVYDKLEKVEHLARSVDMEITPCIATMLTRPAPEGERNATAFTLARFFRSCELDEDSCRQIIMAQPHWEQFEVEGREVSKVLRSVYRTKGQSHLGCRGQSQTAEIMRSYCASPCPFRQDFDHQPWQAQPKATWETP